MLISLIPTSHPAEAGAGWLLPPQPNAGAVNAGTPDARPPSVRIGPHAAFPVEALDAGHLYRLASGCLALYRRLDAERRQILDILGPGRLFERAVVDRLQCEVVALAPAHLEPVLTAPAAREALAAQNRELMLSRALGHVTRLGRQGACERVAATLLDLARQFGDGALDRRAACAGFPLHLSRADLADWLGLTLETVSRCMSRLRQDALIDFDKDGTLTLLDIAALEMIAVGVRKVDDLYATRSRTPRRTPPKASRKMARPAALAILSAHPG